MKWYLFDGKTAFTSSFQDPSPMELHLKAREKGSIWIEWMLIFKVMAWRNGRGTEWSSSCFWVRRLCCCRHPGHSTVKYLRSVTADDRSWPCVLGEFCLALRCHRVFAAVFFKTRHKWLTSTEHLLSLGCLGLSRVWNMNEQTTARESCCFFFLG